MGSNKFSGTVTKLSGVTKSLTSSILTDPSKMETIIGLVRTAVPLTSVQTVSKVNTYLPIFEKVSTLLGMYAFLSRAQNYTPIQSLNAKTPMEKVTALISNGNLPVGKMLAQPLIANNMDKIISAVSKDLIAPMIRNGNLNLNLNDIISSMSKQFSNDNSGDSQENGESNGENNNMDLSSLMETFMPIMNNIMSGNSSSSDNITNDEKDTIHTDNFTNILNDQDTKEKNSPDKSNDEYANINETSSPSSENINSNSNNTTPLEIKPRNRKRRYY